MPLKAHKPKISLDVDEIVRSDAEGGSYKLLEALPSGGRGQTFIARMLQRPKTNWPLPKTFTKGAKVVIKTANIDKERSPEEILYFVDRVNSTLQREISLLHLLNGLHNVARTLDSGIWTATLSDGRIARPMFIVQEYIAGESIRNSLNKQRPTANKWFRLAKHLATVVKEIHQRSVCHGDIWPNNFIIHTRNSRPVIIDFGEAAFRDVTYLMPGFPPPEEHPYMAPECRGRNRWPSRRADLYSLGGVLYYMAVGKDPPLHPSPDDDLLKKQVTQDIKESNQRLLTQNCGIADVIARCLRFDREKRVRNAEALLQEMRTFDLRTRPPGIKKILEQVHLQVNLLGAGGNELFRRMAEVELRQLECRIQDMTHRILHISGDHETLVYGLTQYLAVLRKGDEYLAVSTPQFWSAGNLGINGRYLAMNKLIAERGVRIRRVFLLTREEVDDSQVNEILMAHLELHGDLPKQKKGMMEIRYLVMDSSERKEAVKDGEHCGIWIRKGETMMITPVYDDKNVMTTIRLRRPEQSERTLRNRFKKYFEAQQALPLDKWFGSMVNEVAPPNEGATI